MEKEECLSRHLNARWWVKDSIRRLVDYQIAYFYIPGLLFPVGSQVSLGLVFIEAELLYMHMISNACSDWAFCTER